ncbi:hypothetical protein [Solwaraspora sp. WMMD792]|uniref:hypothetical protein n=1 Tax=Solwaraspora sp. WMMD792 TaxID=3016099 RepID=UPI0024168251|nr:hypothetical protein [Solwaraspora sp. WMMD792]MDG4773803.1 hypothetical protein [Solwaraspora sp. WMMD792]
MGGDPDWSAWHEAYADPDSALSRRLAVVQARIRETLDAARSAHYAGAVPADLVLLCGVFGNIADVDVARVVAAAPQLTAAGGTVIWTRHRREPDLVPRILEWFAVAGFVQVWLSEKSEGYGVGVHRFAGVPAALRLRLDETLFRFVDRD